MMKIEKSIWMYWDKGLEKCPPVVKKCYESWESYNEDWEVLLLDENSISQYIDYSYLKKICRNGAIQALSDLIRINLLAQYGGVWVDATCFCNRPLDEWVEDYQWNGFFSPQRDGIDRLIASWFLASSRENRLIELWKNESNLYWRSNDFRKKNRFKQICAFYLTHYLFRLKPELWLTRVFISIFHIYPYFWFVYIFKKSYKKNQVFKETFNHMKKLPAKELLKFGNGRYRFKASPEEILEIENREFPLYKLAWNYECKNEFEEGSIIDILEKNMRNF